MALSKAARRRLEVAMARRQEAMEIADAIDAGTNVPLTPAAEVSPIVLTPVGTTDGVANDAAVAADVDARLGDVNDQIDAILTALKNAGLMESA